MKSCVKITNKDKEKTFRNESEKSKTVTYCLKKHCFDHTKDDTKNRFMKKLLARMETLAI